MTRWNTVREKKDKKRQTKENGTEMKKKKKEKKSNGRRKNGTGQCTTLAAHPNPSQIDKIEQKKEGEQETHAKYERTLSLSFGVFVREQKKVFFYSSLSSSSRGPPLPTTVDKSE